MKGLLASLDVRIAALDDLRARRVANAEQLSTSDAGEARLEERVENGRKIADELRIEYQKARIAEAVEVGHVEIVDLAVGSAPLGIGLAQQLALGLLLGLVLGGGSAFLTEHLRSSIGRPREIEDLGLTIPKTHNLMGLYALVHPHHPVLRSVRRGLLYLSDFAVDYRYPGNWASKRQAVAALRWAERVRQECRTLLGIKPTRRKKGP